MNEPSAIVVSAVAGILLGIVFFGGLWWTIRRAFSSKHPASLFSGSLLLRTGIAVIGFYYVSRGDWRRLIACLTGFLLARFSVTRMTRTPHGECLGSIESDGR
jgi:F1F0 ATPase subunit 2